MGSPERLDDDRMSASDSLLARAPRVGFFELVRLLERLVPGEARIGGDGPASAETIQFRHDPSLGFPAGDVASAGRATADARGLSGDDGRHPPFEVVTTFLGLTGAASPLPLHIAEEILHEDPDHPVGREFLDLFHHRLLGLFHRGVSRYSFAHEFQSGGDDVLSRRLLALVGVDELAEPRTNALSAAELLRLAPVLAGPRGTAYAVEAAVDLFFAELLDGGRARVEPFVGGVYEFEEADRMRLGVSSSNLGRSSVLGRSVIDRGARFELHLGPLSSAAYRAFLPGGSAALPLCHVLDAALAGPSEFDVVLVLREEARPGFRLDSQRGSRLGEDTFLVGAPGQAEVRLDGAALRRGPTPTSSRAIP